MNTSTYIRKKNYTYVNNKMFNYFHWFLSRKKELDRMSMSTDPISFRLELEKKDDSKTKSKVKNAYI